MTAIVASTVFMPVVCAARPPYTIPPRDKHLKGKITKKKDLWKSISRKKKITQW